MGDSMCMLALRHISARRGPEQLALLFLEGVIALNAVGGAVYGLAGAEGVPREWLDGTPFRSYAIPSLILLVTVGGGMALAWSLMLVDSSWAPEAAIAAGLILVGWIVVQVGVIVPDGGFSWLQPTMLAAGLLVSWLGLRLGRPNSGYEGS
jgi:hypothetical protein